LLFWEFVAVQLVKVLRMSMFFFVRGLSDFLRALIVVAQSIVNEEGYEFDSASVQFWMASAV